MDATAQRGLLASFARLPDPPRARDLRQPLVDAQRVLLDALVVYQCYITTRAAADLQEHERLVAQHNLLLGQVRAALTEHVLADGAAVTGASGDCAFLRR